MTERPDPLPDSIRLGEMLRDWAEKPGVGIASMQNEAGALYDDLCGIAEVEELIRVAIEEANPLPEAFGKYRIIREIGEGGVGIVYEAVDAETDRRVALKVTRESKVVEPLARLRFQQESELAAGLDHPHIVKVYEAGEIDGRLYTAMELLEGLPFDQLLERVRRSGSSRPGMPWLRVLNECGVPDAESGSDDPAIEYTRRIAGLLAPVADAVQALADNGLVHRDIKPHNLVMDGEGRLKLTDFGLARVFGNSLTATVAVIGTPAYMSPEQARGGSHGVDARSDVYGLGATLYEALTLEPPARGATYGEILGAAANKVPPRVDEVFRSIPKPVATLVARCLEKIPGDRCPNARALSDDLVRITAGERPRVGPVPFSRRLRRRIAAHPRAWGISTGVVLVALGIALYFLTRSATFRIHPHPNQDVRVAVDRGPLKDAPWVGDVSPGWHTVTIEHKLFQRYRHRFDLDPGQVFALSPTLVPKDEHQADAMRLILESLKSKGRVPTSELFESRGVPAATDPWFERVSLIGPRGTITPNGLGVLLFQSEPMDGLVVTLRREGETEPAATLKVPATSGEVGLMIDQETQARIREGGTWTVRLTRPSDDTTVLQDEFSVDEEKRGFGARLEAFQEHQRGEWHVHLVVVAELLAAELSYEAYIMAARTVAWNPRNALALRYALEALMDMDATDGARYATLYDAYLDAVEGSG